MEVELISNCISIFLFNFKYWYIVTGQENQIIKPLSVLALWEWKLCGNNFPTHLVVLLRIESIGESLTARVHVPGLSTEEVRKKCGRKYGIK